MILKVKTLFLDDDNDLKDAMQAVFDLKKFGDYEWYTRAVDLFNNLTDNTQVVVIDHILGVYEETGIEIIKKVKEISPICHCILMSNQNSKKVIIDAYDSGADKYIDKGDPEFINQLFVEIEKGIEKVNREFKSHVAILSRMEESIKIFKKAN